MRTTIFDLDAIRRMLSVNTPVSEIARRVKCSRYHAIRLVQMIEDEDALAKLEKRPHATPKAYKQAIYAMTEALLAAAALASSPQEHTT